MHTEAVWVYFYINLIVTNKVQWGEKTFILTHGVILVFWVTSWWRKWSWLLISPGETTSSCWSPVKTAGRMSWVRSCSTSLGQPYHWKLREREKFQFFMGNVRMWTHLKVLRLFPRVPLPSHPGFSLGWCSWVLLWKPGNADTSGLVCFIQCNSPKNFVKELKFGT